MEYVLLILIIYLIPSIISLVKRKKDAIAIFALNIFLGWTFVGWVVSLVWSLKAERA